MSRMNHFIKARFSFLLIVFLYSQPFLDVVTAIFLEVFKINLTVGMIIRFLFLCFILYSVIFVYQKKKCIIYYGLVFLYGICYVAMLFMTESTFLFSEIQMFIKIFYFPVLLVSIYAIKEHVYIPQNMVARLFCIYLLFLFIPMITCTGFRSYDVTKGGTIGWFYSANEISAILAILFPIFLASFVDRQYRIYKGLFFLMYCVIMMMIGTKVPLFAFFIVFLFSFLYVFVMCLIQKKYRWVGVLAGFTVVAIAAFCFIIPKSTFYKNIQLHLDFLEVKNISDIASSIHLIDHFIFSERITFLERRSISYDHASYLKKLLGLGIHDEEGPSKMIEMDYYDIFYSSGIFGFLLFFVPYLFILYQVYQHVRKEKFYFCNCMNIVSLILILLLSLFSGHVITSPSVSIYCIFILLFNLSPAKCHS